MLNWLIAIVVLLLALFIGAKSLLHLAFFNQTNDFNAFKQNLNQAQDLNSLHSNKDLNSSNQANSSKALNLNSLKTLPALQKGDIILRDGLGLESALIRQISKSDYSHIGLVVSLEPVLILHATTNDDLSKTNQVLLSSLEDFARLSKKIAVKRYDLSKAMREKIIDQALKFKGRAFVLSPDNDAFYCTSLIEETFSGVYDLNLSKEWLSVPALSGTYLLPKAFFNDEKSKLIGIVKISD